MIQVDKVIVTVRYKTAFSVDMELPIFLTVEELKGKVLETLQVYQPLTFLNMHSLQLKYHGENLSNESTLANIGIWDGAVLEIEEGEVYV